MPRGFQRTERIADLIQKSLAQILLQEVSDERFRLVTITSVSVTRDLAYAKVYVSVLEEEQEKVKAIMTALNHAAKYLRYTLAHSIDLRVIPELKFTYDESTRHGFKISSLIDAAMKKEKK